MLQKEDPFLKSVNDACKMLARWKNRYSNRENKFIKANDGVAFMTMGVDKKITATKLI